MKTMENYTIIEGDNIDLAIQYFTMKKEGKEVKVKYLNEAGNWCTDDIPDFDATYKYRLLIPKEKKLVPFDFTDNLVGMIIEHKSKETRRLVVFQDIDVINAGNSSYTYYELFNNFTIYPTGAPCGKEEL
jgi:hypothetical protein